MGEPIRRGRFGPCAAYLESTSRLTRGDVWVPLCLVIADYAHTYWVHRCFATGGCLHSDGAELLDGLVALCVVLVAVGVGLRVRGQSWRSVGLGTEHLGRSLRVGVALAAVLLAGGWLLGAAAGTPPDSPRLLTFGVPFYLVGVGFSEELLWRGVVTTRLAAAFHRHWIGGVLAGALFGLVHLVGALAEGGFSVAVVVANLWRVAVPFGWHFLWWWLYARYDSLAAPTLVHMAVNLSGDLRTGAFSLPV